jgi:hypothetical protein
MSTDINALLFEQRMEEEERARLDKYKRGWLYYKGAHKRQLKVKQGQPDDNVILNLHRLIVDKSAAFLFGKEPTFELQEGETTPAEEALDLLWQRNRKMTLLNEIALSGGITGDVFVKMVPEEGGPPRLINIPAEYCRAFWSTDDIEDVWLFLIQWVAMDRNGKGVVHRQRIMQDDGGRWQIINEIARGGERWGPDPDNPDISWPFDWPPIIHCQNLLCPGAYYGDADIEDVSEQDAINYIASKIQRIIRYHQHPKTIGKNFKPGDVKILEDDVLVLPGSDSDLWNLEMQSDLGASQTFMDRLISWYLAGSRIPRVDPAVINVGALSGFALRVLYGDLLEKTNVKQQTYGDMLIELNRRALELEGEGAENLTTIHWQDPLPKDPRGEAEADGFELDRGLASKETVRARRGLDNDAELERLQAEQVAEGNIGALLIRNFTQGQQTGFEA